MRQRLTKCKTASFSLVESAFDKYLFLSMGTNGWICIQLRVARVFTKNKRKRNENFSSLKKGSKEETAGKERVYWMFACHFSCLPESGNVAKSGKSAHICNVHESHGSLVRQWKKKKIYRNFLLGKGIASDSWCICKIHVYTVFFWRCEPAKSMMFPTTAIFMILMIKFFFKLDEVDQGSWRTHNNCHYVNCAYFLLDDN